MPTPYSTRRHLGPGSYWVITKAAKNIAHRDKYLGLWWMIDIGGKNVTAAASLDSQARSYWCAIRPCKWKWTVDWLSATARGAILDVRPNMWGLDTSTKTPLSLLPIGRRNKNHFLRFLSFILIHIPRSWGLFFFNRTIWTAFSKVSMAAPDSIEYSLDFGFNRLQSSNKLFQRLPHFW